MTLNPFETPDRIDALKRRPRTESGMAAAARILEISDAVELDYAAKALLGIGEDAPALAVFEDKTYIAYASPVELKEDLDVIDDITLATGGIVRIISPGESLPNEK